MTNYHEQATSAFKNLMDRGNMSTSNDNLKLLDKNPNDINQYKKRLEEIYEAIFRGFFHCSARGITLCPEEKVAERFGNSIENNYPEANEVFLKFAKTYWTLRVLVYDLMENNDMEWIGAHLLGKLEQDIGPVFFPFPGPKKIAPSKREKFQRELLEEFSKDIDIEEFMKGNPILIRDRESSIWGKLKNLF